MTGKTTSDQHVHSLITDDFLDALGEYSTIHVIADETGHSVFLKLDGGYSVREEAEAEAESFATDFRNLLDKFEDISDAQETSRPRVFLASEMDEPKLIDFAPWELDSEVFVLQFQVSPNRAYEVDLEECLTSADVLDSIMQVAQKTWATDAVVAGLIRGLNEVLNPQAHLCSSGKSKKLTKAKVRALVRHAARRQTAG